MKKLIFSVLACFAMLSVSAQTVTIENLNYVKGEAGSFDICLRTDADIYSAYAFYLYLPETLNFATRTNKIVADGDAVTDDNELDYTWKASTKFPAKDGYKQYMLAVYDKKGELLHTSEGGSLVTISYLASELEADVLPIIIQESQFSKPNGESIKSDEVITAISTLNAGDNANGNVVAYDLTGRKTTANAPGVKVINGKKVIK